MNMIVEQGNNKPFTGWIGLGHATTMSDKFPSKMVGEMPPRTPEFSKSN